jgi:excisionase family DNA binding protein
MILSLSEVAERLGVSERRVRQRISDGSLRAEKVGGRWLLDEADVLELDGRRVGRPLSADSAWALVGAAELLTDRGHGSHRRAGALLTRVAPTARSRARARLGVLLDQVRGQRGADEAEELAIRAASDLRMLLRKRAVRAVYCASPRDLDDLRADHRVQLSGLSLPESGIAAGGVVEAYVGQQDRSSLIRDYVLEAAWGSNANVIFHVVSEDGPGLETLSGVLDGWLVLAADLAEHRHPREEFRSVELMRRLADVAAL